MTGLTRKAATCQRITAVLKMLPLLAAVLMGYACSLAAAQANSTAEAASKVDIPLSVSANSSSLPQAMIPSSISEVLNAAATATGGAVGGRRSLLQGTAYYTFTTGTPANPRKCVDVPGRSTTSGIQLQQWDCNGTPAQTFTLYDTGSYWYTVRNTNSGLCWTANNGGSTSGTAVVQALCANSNHQKFGFFRVSSGWNLKPYHNQNMCLDINWNSPDNGAKVQLWSCNQTPAQYFTTSTGGGGTTSSQPPPTNVGNDALSLHNSFRARHGSAPLTWSASLASSAQGWANQCVWDHAQGTGQGENLYWSSSSSATAADAVRAWYDEISLYNSWNSGFPSNFEYVGHFTQVVWRGTQQVGCAARYCPNVFSGGQFIVCRYSPQGNVVGEFAANVRPPSV